MFLGLYSLVGEIILIDHLLSKLFSCGMTGCFSSFHIFIIAIKFILLKIN